MKKKLATQILSAIILFAGLSFFAACSSDSEKTDESAPATNEKQGLNQAQQVLYSMPSPFELASLLKNSGATFNKELINSPDNIAKYTTSKSRALNLGIYGADLSYASIFGQTQESMGYLKCVKGLTEALGISSAFDRETMDRLEKNKANDDSLQQVVAEAYLAANAFLKDNDRAKAASLILAGGWVEGLYIATSLSKDASKNNDLMSMIAEQKFSLENLVALLEAYEEDQGVMEVLKDMNGLLAIYNKLEEAANAKVEIKTDTVKNVTEIGGDAAVSMNPLVANEIAAKVNAIRNAYIQ